MNTPPEQNSESRALPLLSLALLFAVPVIAGALLAPQVYAFLDWLGQYIDLGPHLTHPMFKRVFSRCVLAVAVLMFYPAVRLSGIRSLAALGWPAVPNRGRAFARWFFIGAVSMLLIYVACDLSGALCFRPRSPEIAKAITKWGMLLVGSLFIGLFEETFFRGYVFGMFRKRLPFWAAAFAGSALFAVIHLARPGAPEGLDPTHWLSGFRLLPHFMDGVEARYLAPSMTNLFLMGILLCILCARFGSLHAAAGLHGGWVFAQGIGTYLFDRNGNRFGAWLGPSETIAMTWLGAVVLLLFIAWALPFAGRKGTRGTA